MSKKKKRKSSGQINWILFGGSLVAVLIGLVLAFMAGRGTDLSNLLGGGDPDRDPGDELQDQNQKTE